MRHGKDKDQSKDKNQPGSKDDQGNQKQPGSKDDLDNQKQPGSKDDLDNQKQPGSKDDQGNQKQPGSKDDQGNQKQPGSKDDQGNQKQPGSKDDLDNQEQPGSKDDQGSQKQTGDQDDLDNQEQQDYNGPSDDQNVRDRRDVQLNSWKDLSEVLSKELADYPNVIKMKVKAGDIQSVLDGMGKAYDEYSEKNRTQYGNVSYGLRSTEPDGNFTGINSNEDILDIEFYIDYVKYGTNEKVESETLREYKAESEKVVNDFVNKEIKNKNLSDAEKVLKINNFLAENARYNHDSVERGEYIVTDHIAYGVLVKGIGVCESYAKAFDLLAKKSGLETIYVTGKAFSSPSEQGESHAWNMVIIDGDWYNIDTTWNDQESGVIYDYFLKPDSVMKATHIRDDSYPYPEANGSKDFSNILVK